ncbi:hypothetical protein QAD02_008228 [Eretmocerus hayati]|uniref:Uncharacterized protein n=1 Tax=Eretmocerus hayati TaxID=131215 RepID=A0ACC2N7C8_9HYME|nr:hypothetical protein QAD02_008228 [Eretmocerus hayati]
MILAGLWIGPTKPDPELFLSVFRKDLKKLFKEIELQTHSGTDSVLNPELRTTAETELHAEQALEKKEPVFGINGPSYLRLIMLNYMISMTIDIMHAVYLGITKKVMKIWFDPSLRTHPAPLSSYIDFINARKRQLKLPSYIPRIPRDVSDYNYFEASGDKTFLLVYSPIILDGIMEKKYLEHHLLLVHGISLLNKSCVTGEDIAETEKLLTEYDLRFEFLYGKKYRTCNLHLLQHSPENVEKFGLGWNLNCFALEHLNGELKSYVHGSKNPELQIHSAVVLFMIFEDLKTQVLRPDSEIAKFCEKISKSGTHRRKTKHLIGYVYSLGKLKRVTEPPQNILANKLHIFQRALKGSTYLETWPYARKKEQTLHA